MPKFKKEKKVVRARDGKAPSSGGKVPVLPFVGYRQKVNPSYFNTFGVSGLFGDAAGNVQMDPAVIQSQLEEISAPIRRIKPPENIPGATGTSSSAGSTASTSAASQPTNVAPTAQGRRVVAPAKAKSSQVKSTPQGRAASMADLGLSGISAMLSGAPAVDPLAGLPSRQLPSMTRGMRFDMPEGEQQELESMMKSSGAAGIAGEIPKTKAGLKKFMQEYGKFIALGAMAGQGGKGGQIAAPIIAALPGLIEMMKGKKSSKSSDAPKSSVQTGMAHGGSVGKKSSGGEPPKKSEGGAIRKFKGGSMKGNTKDSMLTPKYKKGGATGEMPQHKKMAMGKPTPQSMKQKFAKGGTMKCASGGVPKGYGISKKIRPTGPMN